MSDAENGAARGGARSGPPDGGQHPADGPAEPAHPGTGGASSGSDVPSGGDAPLGGDEQDAPSGGDEQGGDELDPQAASAEQSRRRDKGRKRGKRRKRSLWRELPILIVIALVLAVVIKTFALQAFFIPSGSMENTLDINDRVLINKLIYDFRGIHRGDIVVFDGDGTWNPGTLPGNSNFFSEFISGFASMFGLGNKSAIYVKRVIGLPGDYVACCDAQGRVTVNSVPLDESSYLYPKQPPSAIRFNVTVPDDHLWVMGDHRAVSEDSRYHPGSPGGGSIPESSVLGRAFVIIWPPSRWRTLPIPATFQQPAISKQAAAANDLLGARLEPAGPALPLALGFAGAVPLTWAHRLIRSGHRRAEAAEPGTNGHELAYPAKCHDPSIRSGHDLGST